MRKVVMGIILVFLVVAGFAGLVKGENFGYWPSSTGNAPSGTYENIDLWRDL